MPIFKYVLHFLLIDFGEGYLLIVVTCDGGKTKSTRSPIDLNWTVRLDWSLTIKSVIEIPLFGINIYCYSRIINLAEIIGAVSELNCQTFKV